MIRKKHLYTVLVHVGLVVIFLTGRPVPAPGFSFFEEGERLFMENKTEEAMAMLEAALNEEPSNEKIYLYLSIIYEDLQQYEKAVQVLEEGLPVSEKHTGMMYYNQGNNYYALNQFDDAELSYTRAIQSKPEFAEAYLNRANARLEQEKYPDAVNDYTLYIRMKPSDPQREKIERLIGLLKTHLAQAEQEKRDEEQRRIAEEKRKAQEEERRRVEEEERLRRQEALMKEVLDALEKVEQEDSKMNAEAEDIQEFDFNLEPE